MINFDDFSPKDLKERYEAEIAKDTKVTYFEYYMFLQLYVLTFDENRRMIFWDERASSHALSISFNTSIKDSEQLIEMRRRMDKLESDARNARWQARQLKNKLKQLVDVKDEIEGEGDLVGQHDSLLKQQNEIENEHNNVSQEYDTLLKSQSYLNSDIMSLRMELSKLFSIYSEPRSKLLNNTYVKLSIDKNECLICGAQGDQVVENFKINLYKDRCPLCTTKIREDEERDQEELLNKIEKTDKKIAQKTKKLEKTTLEISAKKVEIEKLNYEIYDIKSKITSFEKEHNSIDFNKSENTSFELLVSKYRESIDEYDHEADKKYRDRDKLKPNYNNMQNKITSAYKDAEILFVPIFQKLAKSFIGYDLNVSFTTKQREMKLVLEMKNRARTESSHLSESQRFFLDIALRMSLAIFLSNEDNEATMLIDTPEGSLDIAYESRVGKMFANFVKEYDQHILMTANINASQLLLSLAQECRDEKMQFRRMLDWTDLSTIQKEGERLFQEVFINIDRALKGNGYEH